MMEAQANPALVQKGDPSRTPLFLIHDAGGTINHYFKLEGIGRPVYAIYNPWFKSETRWEGNSELFVKEYIKLIKTVRSSGEILLGGWSLGGQISIDISRVLAQNSRSRLRVVGIVMIDTLYPYWGPAGTIHAEFPVDFVLKNCPPDMKEAMIRCMIWSREDSDIWCLKNRKTNNPDDLDGIESLEPAPAVLLHATKYVPVADPKADAKCMVDYFRHQKVGWDLFPHSFISAVWEIPTHHFGLFEKDTIKLTSEKVRLASELLADD